MFGPQCFQEKNYFRLDWNDRSFWNGRKYIVWESDRELNCWPLKMPNYTDSESEVKIEINHYFQLNWWRLSLKRYVFQDQENRVKSLSRSCRGCCYIRKCKHTFFSSLHSFPPEDGHLESFFYLHFLRAEKLQQCITTAPTITSADFMASRSLLYFGISLDEVCHIMTFDSPGPSRSGCRSLAWKSSVSFGVRKRWFGSQSHSMGCSLAETELEMGRAEVALKVMGWRRTVERHKISGAARLRNRFGEPMRFLP